MKRLLISLLMVPTLALAQAYPTKPIRMIIPFAPGGASDFVGRIMQPKMNELLGQPIVVENRAGAAGNIGAEAAAKSAPDGYTLFLGNVGSIAINPGVYPKLSINPVKDFVAVNQVVDVPSILIIHP
ncbi:MAG: Bug family tripartite tricarboxylate transporter substrate binding protein, partial [Xanthobacteraceae bacterium]